MSIEEYRVQNTKELINLVEEFALQGEQVLFRGHSNVNHILSTTWNRCLGSNNNLSIDDVLLFFEYGIRRNSISLDIGGTRLERLEIARHFGVPTPVIDFTYSPYVALFFACSSKSPVNDSVLYALRIDRLARCHVTLTCSQDKETLGREKHNFMNPEKLFRDSFPENKLLFIRYPGKRNARMMRQMGCFIFDSLQYNNKTNDLEQYIMNLPDLGDTESEYSDLQSCSIITKIVIGESIAQEIFPRLELMGISGGSLFNSPEGIAIDIQNSKHFSSKASYLRDASFTSSQTLDEFRSEIISQSVLAAEFFS